MEHAKAPFTLALQDRSFPAPNPSPQTADWLPEFLGFSWLAYGSHSSVVISIAPFPPGREEAEHGPLLRKVIDIPEASGKITCVRWAPKGPSNGVLAVAGGECIYVYEPAGVENSDSNLSELPHGWFIKYKIEHTFQVLSFAWTESADGLLSVGTEVVMWKQNESVWCHLWASHPTHPQLLAAATCSAKGLAATADGGLMNLTGASYIQASHGESTRGKATVWWWEDSLGLLEAELGHPQQVLMVQWRPSKGLHALQEPCRPVLLTACRDGAVRLWLEIDSGRARIDKALGKDVSEKHLKPAYFVSAVIEAEQCLHGVLGKDAFVTWALDFRAGSSAPVYTKNTSEGTTISKRQSLGSCEWLIGVGPNGSISMWSLFCLDDIYPPRCPRVLLWKQATGLIPDPDTCADDERRLSLIKAVARWLGDKSADPPSSVDLFCIVHKRFFQWSRVWPPVSAIGGGGSKERLSSGVSNSKTLSSFEPTAKKDAWGVANESLHIQGHSYDIIGIAVHPITSTGLVASLDSRGEVFLWYNSTFSYIAATNSALCAPIWKPCGQLVGSSEFTMLTWLPAVFSGDRTLLLLAHAGIVTFYLVSKDACSCQEGWDMPSLVFNPLFKLNLCTYGSEKGLKGIWAFPTQACQSDLEKSAFVIIGLSQGGHELISWNLKIIAGLAESDSKALEPSDPHDDHMHASSDCQSCTVNHGMQEGKSMMLRAEMNISLEARLMDIVKLEDSEQILSFDIVPLCFSPYLQKKINCLMFEPVAVGRPYDFATGSAGGILKLWKAGIKNVSDGTQVEDTKHPLHCVGTLEAYSGPLVNLAVGSCGLRIATVGSEAPEFGSSILIWDIESYLDSGAFIDSGRILLPCLPSSIKWLEVGNGQSILGVLIKRDLYIYAESRGSNGGPEAKTSLDAQSLNFSSWTLLASASLMSGVSSLSWGPKGSVIVPHKDHILVYGQKVFRNKLSKVFNEANLTIYLPDSKLSRLENLDWPFCNLLEAAYFLSGPLPMYHPVSILYHLFTGDYRQARVCLSRLQECMNKLCVAMDSGDPYDLLWTHPIHLMNLSHLEAMKRVERPKTSGSSLERINVLDWSTPFQESENNSAMLKKMVLSEVVNGSSVHGEADTSGKLDLGKFEVCIQKTRNALGLSEDEKIQLLAAADVLEKLDVSSKASEHGSLDLPGQRFWLGLHLSHCNQSRRARKDVCLEDLVIDSKAMAWALQSDCKTTLLDMCLLDQLSWPAMRSLGVGFWFTDIAQLRMKIEKLARAQFLRQKDPKDCALLYLALQRKNVLVGLFKLSKDETDKVLFEFLARDFEEEKNRAAALKNAYVLMGKHRHELAVAFFLLGGDLSSAVAVCAKNLGDVQLAFVICRLLEGIGGQTEQSLIKEYALPNAQNEGDHWMASLYQWHLGERLQAIQELTGNFKVSVISGGSYFENKGKAIYAISRERSELAFVDPDVGHYCLLLTTKPSIQWGLSVACAITLRRWIISKTSTALKRLGLPMEALEHLGSGVRVEEAHLDHSHAMDVKECTTGDVHEKYISTDLQSQEADFCGSISSVLAVEILSAMKMMMAVQYQAKLVQAHPLWRFEEHFWYSAQQSGSARGIISDLSKIGLGSITLEANEKFMQSLGVLETRFAVNAKYILAELATLSYYQNRLYLQCLFTMEAPDQAESTKQLMQSMLISSSTATFFLDKVAKEIPRFLIYPALACGGISKLSEEKAHMQNLSFLYGDISRGTRSPNGMIEILLLASDLRFLLISAEQDNDKEDCTGKYPESIALLIFVLCCVAAWHGRHADAIHIVAGLFVSFSSTFSSSVPDIDKLFQKISASSGSSIYLTRNRINSQILSDTAHSGHLTDFEIWHVLGVAFWDSLYGWVKKQFGHKLPGDLHKISLDQVSHGKGEKNEECILKSLSCISLFFRRELVSYVNRSFEISRITSLHLWIWDSQLPSVSSPTRVSPRAGLAQGEAFQLKDQSFHRCLSKETSVSHDKGDIIAEVWRLLVVRDNIQSALELEGAKQEYVRFFFPESVGCGWRKSLEQLPESGVKADIAGKSFCGKDSAFRNSSEQVVKSSMSYGSNRKLERPNMEYKVSNQFQKAEEVLHSNGDLFEAICVNSCCPEQIVVASNRKGLIYVDLSTGDSFSNTEENLWSQAEWPNNGWAKSESTPVPTFVSPGVGLGSKEGPGLGLGGATVGLGTLPKSAKDFSLGGAGFGIPGYAGVGPLGMGWGDWEDFDGVVDPPATVENMNTKALDAHPLRPLFLVGSRNTHIYLWEFGKTSATATYGVLPAANIPPPYALASVSAVRFDLSGHRFATAAVDGTLCIWQLEVGGRSNVRPTEACLCFDRHSSDVAFVGASGGILAATGSSQNGCNLVVWDTLAPASTSRASILCHEGGARSLEMFDHDVGGGSISPIIVTGGKAGDIAVHDFRYIATGKSKHQRHGKRENAALSKGAKSSPKKASNLRNHQDGELNINGMIWYIAKAHAGSISCISAVPGTSLFFTGSKDGDVKLWDVNKCELVYHWHKVHDRHMFLQNNARGFGAVVQAAVSDVQPVSLGFLTCGGDGVLKLFRHQDAVHKAI